MPPLTPKVLTPKKELTPNVLTPNVLTPKELKALTPKGRVRLTLKQKVKIIEDSKKVGFNKKNIQKEYGISRERVNDILKKKAEILEKTENLNVSSTSAETSETKHDTTMEKADNPEIEKELSDWFNTKGFNFEIGIHFDF